LEIVGLGLRIGREEKRVEREIYIGGKDRGVK
jgi:hypothetical protein